MGVAIEVGALADLLQNDEEGAEDVREWLAHANALLAQAGLPQHEEPEELPELEDRGPTGTMPYSYLHHLRRVAVRYRLDPLWKAAPVADGVDPSEDLLVVRAASDLGSHLVAHSDAEGLYVPVDFKTVLVDEATGNLLGSSQRLLAELVAVAPCLGIRAIYFN
jgi:hypothetical protein